MQDDYGKSGQNEDQKKRPGTFLSALSLLSITTVPHAWGFVKELRQKERNFLIGKTL
jgi:hypothetical protein